MGLFLLAYFISWGNAYAVQGATVDNDTGINPFNNFYPLIYGLLIMGVLAVLILVSLDKLN